MVNSFPISVTSDRLWNLQALLRFLHDNQHSSIELTVEPEAIDIRRLGVYELIDLFDFESVTINTRNPFESHDRYRIKQISNHWLPQKPTISADLHTWSQRKLFLALYSRPTAARLAIAAHLHVQHRALSHLHFKADLTPDNLVQFELDKALAYDTTAVASIGHLIDDLPLLLSSPENYTATHGYDYADTLTTLYQDILVDIVVESHVVGDTFFPTEKTLRPMWLKKPFIVFASANYLEYLRQMGFRTFGDFWCEEYDGYEAGDRLRRITSVIDQLSTMSHSDLEQMYWDMQYSLEHNFKLLQSQSYKLELSKLPYDG
jgi:hypothetical protein